MKNIFLLFILCRIALVADTIEVTVTEQNTMLIALFGLAFIGIAALFLSSQQLSRLKSEHKKMRELQEQMENRQSELLVEMSKNIQNITKETLGDTSKLKTTNESVKKHINKVLHSENTIIDATSDLIEFLQIKSKKIHPINEVFKLENLLNDILGQISSNHKSSDLEVIFDVDDNIPDILNSDTLGISKILVNLIEFCIANSSKQIVLQVSKRSKFNAPTTLHFVVYADTTVKIDKSVFKTTYNEDSKKYDGMAMFVSNELSQLMGGNIIARNNYKDSNVEFVLNLPFNEVNASKLKQNTLDTRRISNEKIFLIDSSNETTLAIKRMIETLKCEVDINTVEEFRKQLPDFSSYTTLIMDERVIDKKLQNIIRALDEDHRPKIVTLGNIFSKSKQTLLEGAKLYKPLTKESIYYTLLNKKEDKRLKREKSTYQLKVQKERFAFTADITLDSFSHFANSNLLVVEDNHINQKVLTSMLKKSNINITIANDGQEAIDILYKNNKFDMVLMDINMPIMDGYEATKKIRENHSLDMVPVVALSALTAADEINKVYHVGMNGYLSKPLEKERLYSAFSAFINKTDIIHETSASAESNIKKLDGLNIQSGLKQTSNNPIFYIEVLKEFLDAYGESDSVFNNLVQEHRYEQIRMLCLDMRGLAGAVGASEMQELSGEILQRLIFKKYEMLPDYAQKYKEKLSILKRSINKYISLNS